MAYMSHKNLKGKRLLATPVWFKDLARYTIYASSFTLLAHSNYMLLFKRWRNTKLIDSF